MSSTPTRPDLPAEPASALPLEQGVRVLASIGNQEGLRALLAFSDLHENILSRRGTDAGSDPGLLQTERFVLQEVLQLICARAQALTRADNVLIALADNGEFVCRASAGVHSIPHGMRLNRASALLADCFHSGQILRCDDAAHDARSAFDFTRQFAARSTVLVPLRGHNERLGVLQAFSAGPRFFTDADVRCLDLLAELVLSALKPADQDRRWQWLSELAGELLWVRPAEVEPAAAEPMPPPLFEPTPAPPTVEEPGVIQPPSDQIELPHVKFAIQQESPAPAHLETAPVEPTDFAPDASSYAMSEFLPIPEAPRSAPLPDLGNLTEPIVIPTTIFDAPDPDAPKAGLFAVDAPAADTAPIETKSPAPCPLKAESPGSSAPATAAPSKPNLLPFSNSNPRNQAPNDSPQPKKLPRRPFSAASLYRSPQVPGSPSLSFSCLSPDCSLPVSGGACRDMSASRRPESQPSPNP